MVQALIEGDVVPFFGAAVNLCGRPTSNKWERSRFLPSGAELSMHLAEKHGYPAPDKDNLPRVAQYITMTRGAGPLYKDLHWVFDIDYPVTALHRFFACLPGTLRAKGLPPRHQLIVTTNYDDLMERAFSEAREPFDIVNYVADGPDRGKFLHVTHSGDVIPIERPNEYRGLSLQDRSVVLKIHGAVQRGEIDQDRDSYVITEDHYIDYLTRTDPASFMPVTLLAKMKHSHFLFLGYSLKDWNLRVILHRIWGDRKLSYKSWAIQREPDVLDEKFWNKRDVDILDVDIGDYITRLHQLIKVTP